MSPGKVDNLVAQALAKAEQRGPVLRDQAELCRELFECTTSLAQKQGLSRQVTKERAVKVLVIAAFKLYREAPWKAIPKGPCRYMVYT